MSQCRSVGWYNDDEWKAVYYNLFHGDKAQIRSALDRIAVWRARFAGRIPVAIEATSLLFECVIKEEDDEIKRMSMAAALSQFIGLLTERSLKGQAHHRPIHIRAEELGIPEWVTNVRHEAAHCLLPSGFMLQRAMNFALSWLRTNHWDEQLRKQKAITEPPSYSINDAVEILRNCVLSTQKKAAKNGFEKLSKMFGSDSHAAVLGEILLDYNFMPLDAGQENCFLYTNNKLLSFVQSFFKKIFQLLGEHGALGAFFNQLIGTLSLQSTSKSLCVMWMEFVLDFVSLNPELIQNNEWKSLIAKLVTTKSPKFLVEKALSMSCLDNYSSIIEIVEINNGDRRVGSACYTQDGTLASTIEEERIVNKSAEISETNLPESFDSPKKVWTTYHSEELSDCPLGLMPGQDPSDFWQSLGKFNKTFDDTFIVEDDTDYCMEPDFISDDENDTNLKYILCEIDIL